MLALFKDKVYERLTIAENAIWLRTGMVAVDGCFSIIVNELKPTVPLPIIASSVDCHVALCLPSVFDGKIEYSF